MTKILVDVDDEALAEAMELLGTTTKKDTVNEALLEVARRTKRRRALKELQKMGDSGYWDEFLDKRSYRWVAPDHLRDLPNDP